MAHTTASRAQLDIETYMTGTLSMVAYPAFLDSVSQVLAPATEYFAVQVNQTQLIRTQDSNIAHVQLQISLDLLYRFTTNEAEYLGSASTPTDSKAALALLMDVKFWEGTGGSFSWTAGPLSVQSVEPPEVDITRVGRVITSKITLTLVTTSV